MASVCYRIADTIIIEVHWILVDACRTDVILYSELPTQFIHNELRIIFNLINTDVVTEIIEKLTSNNSNAKWSTEAKQ